MFGHFLPLFQNNATSSPGRASRLGSLFLAITLYNWRHFPNMGNVFQIWSTIQAGNREIFWMNNNLYIELKEGTGWYQHRCSLKQSGLYIHQGASSFHILVSRCIHQPVYFWNGFVAILEYLSSPTNQTAKLTCRPENAWYFWPFND